MTVAAGGDTQDGSCCKWDERVYSGFCTAAGAQQRTDPAAWAAACDPTSPQFGTQSFVVLDNNTRLESVSKSLTKEHLVQQDAPFCDVLGKTQRYT